MRRRVKNGVSRVLALRKGFLMMGGKQRPREVQLTRARCKVIIWFLRRSGTILDERERLIYIRYLPTLSCGLDPDGWETRVSPLGSNRCSLVVRSLGLDSG